MGKNAKIHMPTKQPSPELQEAKAVLARASVGIHRAKSSLQQAMSLQVIKNVESVSVLAIVDGKGAITWRSGPSVGSKTEEATLDEKYPVIKKFVATVYTPFDGEYATFCLKIDAENGIEGTIAIAKVVFQEGDEQDIVSKEVPLDPNSPPVFHSSPRALHDGDSFFQGTVTVTVTVGDQDEITSKLTVDLDCSTGPEDHYQAVGGMDADPIEPVPTDFTTPDGHPPIFTGPLMTQLVVQSLQMRVVKQLRQEGERLMQLADTLYDQQ